MAGLRMVACGLSLVAWGELAAVPMLGRRCGCHRESADGLTPTSEPNDGEDALINVGNTSQKQTRLTRNTAGTLSLSLVTGRNPWFDPG
jgi:hypothetical protein